MDDGIANDNEPMPAYLRLTGVRALVGEAMAQLREIPDCERLIDRLGSINDEVRKILDCMLTA